jgi:branched-chain amino acid transport system ATP-binding protein
MIKTENLTKTFDKFVAVNNVTVRIPDGQVTAMIGPNGAGKTTFINLLTGRLIPDGGHIYFRNHEVTTVLSSARVGLGMGRSFQVTNIFPKLSVAENIAIPALAHAGQTLSMFQNIKAAAEWQDNVERIIRQVGLEDMRNLPAGQLSHGDQRRLEIGLALTTDPRMLILDEPTAGMNPKERKVILALLKRLAKQEKLTLLLVEHDMDIVFSLANRIVVLNEGQLFAEGLPGDIRNNSRVLDIYLGAAISGLTSIKTKEMKSAGRRILEVNGIDTFYGLSQALHNVTMEVHEGEAVALLGRNGVGKTTTLRSIMGLTPPKKGSIRLCDEEISKCPPYGIARKGVGYVPDDRRIIPNLTTRENLMIAAEIKGKRNGSWTFEKVEEIFPQLRKLSNRKGGVLSGGEQKMLSIGRALMGDPSLLLLDEPSEGLSPAVIGMLLEALLRIRQEGVTILLADQNINFARLVADRAYILEKGAVVYSGEMEDLWKDDVKLKEYLAV